MRLLITNKQDNEEHVKELETFTDARHWIINHLDSSKDWQVQDITPASRINMGGVMLDRVIDRLLG